MVEKLDVEKFKGLLDNPYAYEIVKEWISRRVRKDDVVKEMVFRVALSAYTDEPLNLFLRGPSSIGKTWNVVNVLKIFPQKDIWYLGGLSPTALVHDYGVLVDEDGIPIDFEGMEKGEIKNKMKRAKYIVDLTNKILVFLEAPHQETYLKLRPILSHDKEEIEYKFTEKGPKGSLRTSWVILRGWPATIFCTTEAKYLEDLATRSFTITPEESQEKIREAHQVTSVRFGFPQDFLDRREKIELAYIRNWVDHVKGSSVKVLNPFITVLKDLFPAKVSRDMRDFNKYLMLVKTNTIIHYNFRPILRIDKIFDYTLTTIEDIHVADNLWTKIAETTRMGISETSILFYRNVLAKIDAGEITYDMVKEKYQEIYGRSLPKSTLTTYLKELESIGWVETGSSSLDRRRKVILLLEKNSSNCSEKFEELIKAQFTIKKTEEWFNELKKIVRTNSILLIYGEKEIPANPDTIHEIVLFRTNFKNDIKASFEEKSQNREKNGSSNYFEQSNYLEDSAILCDFCKRNKAKYWFERDGLTVWVCEECSNKVRSG